MKVNIQWIVITALILLTSATSQAQTGYKSLFIGHSFFKLFADGMMFHTAQARNTETHSKGLLQGCRVGFSGLGWAGFPGFPAHSGEGHTGAAGGHARQALAAVHSQAARQRGAALVTLWT